MPNIHRTSRRPSQIHHRPAHLEPSEIREAFAFWLGVEALLNLLSMCGFEFFRWLHEAMEAELIPALAVALILFVIYTPASRYGILLMATKSYGHQLGHTILQLRVEQILKALVGHHMRTILLWVGGTACMHAAVQGAKFVLNHDKNASIWSVRIGDLPPHKPLSVTTPAPSIR